MGCSWAKALTPSQVLGHFGNTGRDRGIKTPEQDIKERSVEVKDLIWARAAGMESEFTMKEKDIGQGWARLWTRCLGLVDACLRLESNGSRGVTSPRGLGVCSG